MEIKWTKIDAAIDKAARDEYNENEKIYNDLNITHANYYGELIGMFKAGVEWAIRHYRLLGFTKTYNNKK